MADLTDEEVAAKVQRGDAELFGILVGRYEEKITRYGRKFLTNRDDIKDLVQEVFLKAYSNIQSFDTSRKFSPWVYRIAHNDFVNSLKKRSRLPMNFFDPELLFPHPVAKETADGELEKEEIKKMLDRGFGKIDEKYKEILILYYFEEMDYKQISEVLQMPVATVGVRLKRGREALRKKVEPEMTSPYGKQA